MTKKRLIFTLLLVLIVSACLLAVFFLVPHMEDKRRNVVYPGRHSITARTASLHEQLFIADLHADTLLWGRSLAAHHSYGHIDIPRLMQGNIGLQVFSVVTKTPRNLNLSKNNDDSDNITLLAIAQRWPHNTWKSLLNRAIYQSEKLQAAASNSSGLLQVVRTQSDMQSLLHSRSVNHMPVGAVLSLEGAHALEGRLENVDVLFKHGFRIIGFSHFFDNELGGSAHGIQKYGITKFGTQVLQRMESLSMLVDVAHASPALIDDILRLSSRPVISTHTGVNGMCKQSLRNLSDRHIRAIAQTGGLIGIGFWPAAICTEDTEGIVHSIRYVVNLVGEDYVALGSDFDGNVQTPFDAGHMQSLTQALLDNHFTEVQIRKIMGGNVQRVLLESLPH